MRRNVVIILIVALTVMAYWSISGCGEDQTPGSGPDQAQALNQAQPVQTSGAVTGQKRGEIKGESFIRLVAGTFDPLTQLQTFPFDPDLYLEEYPDDEGAYLVQLFGPIDASMKSEITDLGIEIHGYIPDFTFLVWLNPEQKSRLQQLNFVRWIGIYQPQFRIAPQVRQQARQNPDDQLELRIDSFQGMASAKALTGRIESLGGTVLKVFSANRLELQIRSSELTELAHTGMIRWIEPKPEYILNNDQSREIMDVASAWTTEGLYGTGQILAIADTGLDRCECGTCALSRLHDDFEDGAGVSRVLQLFDVGGDGTCRDPEAHGTHVAGSAVGNGQMSGASPASRTYPSTCFAGAAPEAGLIFQALFNESSGHLELPPLADLFEQARLEGARIHTNSWGASQLDQYTTNTRDADQYMWDNQDFLILFSAGNYGADHDADGVIDGPNIGVPATAKNVLTVGASERYSHPGGVDTWGDSWPNNFPADPIFSDDVSDDAEGMAAFSSRGPTVDGRYKPDIVAPGTNIISTRSSQGGTLWGEYDANYRYSGGTSMSTPLTAGAAIQIRQWLMDVEGVTPSAALLKALIGNGAVDMAPGQYGTGAYREIPYEPEQARNIQGLGLVNVIDSIDPDSGLIYDDQSPGLATGESFEKTFYVTDNSNPLRLTLAWTDCPGTEAAGGGLVNDLDLSLDSPSETFYPDGANQRGPTTVINYFDNVTYNVNSAPDIGRAVRFTPAEYPRRLDRALIFISASHGLLPRYININVYDDDGPVGTPGTILYTETRIPIRQHGVYWYDHDLSPNIQIIEGSFYIEVYGESGDYGPPYFISTGDNVQYRSWDHDMIADTWIQLPNRENGLRAVMKANDYSWTFFDRINNLLRIELLYPDVGFYTMNVEGYNVPGCDGATSQPFAYAISGDIFDWECEVAAHCDDGNPCNGDETCLDYRCQPGAPLFCNDGVFCNGEETCHPNEGCLPGTQADCSNHTYCDGVEYCDPELDRCVDVPESCPDNGLFCDGLESCDELNMRCITPQLPCDGWEFCCEDDDSCSNDPCEYECEVNADCDDGDACNGTETCLDHHCQPGTPPTCNDDDMCNGTEWCDPASGCQVGEPLACNDDDMCNGTEWCDPASGCQVGEPLACNDDDMCNGTEWCDPASGCQPGEPLVCDDGLYCNGTETCGSNVGCLPGTQPDCSSAGDQCNAGVCDEELDECVSIPLTNGTPCVDELFCTQNEICTAGACGGEPRDCSEASDQCNDGICDEQNERCAKQPMAYGAPCDDGLFCTIGETCEAGVCTDGAPRDCSIAEDFCKMGFCDEDSDSCSVNNINEGGFCDDDLFCTIGETCHLGQCEGGQPQNCDNGVFCDGEEFCNEEIDSCDIGPDPCIDYEYCCEDEDLCSNEPCQACDCPFIETITPTEAKQDTLVEVQLTGGNFNCEYFEVFLKRPDDPDSIFLGGVEILADDRISGVFDLTDADPGDYDVWLFTQECQSVIEDGFTVTREGLLPWCGLASENSSVTNQAVTLLPLLMVLGFLVFRRRR